MHTLLKNSCHFHIGPAAIQPENLISNHYEELSFVHEKSLHEIQIFIQTKNN